MAAPSALAATAPSVEARKMLPVARPFTTVRAVPNASLIADAAAATFKPTNVAIAGTRTAAIVIPSALATASLSFRNWTPAARPEASSSITGMTASPMFFARSVSSASRTCILPWKVSALACAAPPNLLVR